MMSTEFWDYLIPTSLQNLYCLSANLAHLSTTPLSVRTSYMEAPLIEIYHTIVMVCLPNFRRPYHTRRCTLPCY